MPEIKLKKEEEKRLNELKARKAVASLYAKELDAKRRAAMKMKSNNKKDHEQITSPHSEQD